MLPFDYIKPTSLTELFVLLESNPEHIRLLAGGTDVLVRIKTKQFVPKTLIDIKGIKELSNQITFDKKDVRIGALTTLADICRSEQIQTMYPALAKAVGSIGSVQIRNRATLTGNICNASPAADSVPALIVYNASVVVTSKHGKKSILLSDFITGPGKTKLVSGEILSAIILPYPNPVQSAAFVRHARRKGVDIATMNLCCLLDKDGLLKLVLGAAGPKPLIVQTILDPQCFKDAEEIKKQIKNLVVDAKPISDVRASKEYRRAMFEVLGFRAFSEALKRLT